MPVNVLEYEALAAALVDPVAWDYYRSGADDEVTLRRNRAGFEALSLHYRVLVDVRRRNLATTVLGHPVDVPVLVAPTAFHRLAHEDGEVGTARGAAGTAMVLSTLSNTDVEDVVAAASGPVFFQLYVYRDRAATEALVRRAEAAGARAIVVTVDAPLLGRREADVRNRFTLPDGLQVRNLTASGYGDLPAEALGSGLAAYFQSLLDPGFTWEDLAWLRGLTTLPLVIKGIVRPDDARRAEDHGADAVVVSNHGGRQLDGSPATIDVLPAIASAVGVEVLLDGGVRRGTDVLKALALGARAVLVGRPILWGLAVGGAAGVRDVLDLFRAELDLALALAGVPDVRAVPRDLVGD